MTDKQLKTLVILFKTEKIFASKSKFRLKTPA